jgi:hypothetical protein
LPQAERAAMREVPLAARSLEQGGSAAAKGNGWRERVKKSVDSAAEGYLDQYKDDLKNNIQKGSWAGRNVPAVMPSPRQAGSGQRFPFPLSSVQPLPGYPPVVDPATGDYCLPNNYGGVIMYDRTGAFIGFSAVNTRTGELWYFDRFGNRI